MNTRKVFFGLLAVAVLMSVSLSTTITIDDNQETGVKRSEIKRK